MKGWLVYDGAGAKRNAWFIEKLQQEFSLLGHQLSLRIAGDGMPFDRPNFVIVRTIDPKINAFFEEKGIPVFNNARTASIACDKWQTYLFCKEHDLPVMETKLMDGSQPFDFPFVLKSRDGHGGSEVYLVREEKEWEEKKKTLEWSRFIAQPLCDETGKDMRVYLLGGDVLAAMLRTSSTDFRSNFSLGGRAEKCRPTNKQLQILKTVKQALAPDFCGVDFIRQKGEWVLNEIEDAVGTRMLYKHTDIDAARAYARHISYQLSRD